MPRVILSTSPGKMIRRRRFFFGSLIAIFILLIVSFFQRPKRNGCCKRDSCKVIAAGMSRSGSTWQYNAARILLRNVDNKTVAGHGQPINLQNHLILLKHLLANPYTIVKSHDFWPEGAQYADCVLLTHRDARDAVVSWMRVRNSTSELQGIQSTLRYSLQYALWLKWCENNPGKCLTMAYKDIVHEPNQQIERLISHLNLCETCQPSSQDVNLEITKALKNTKINWDAVTGFSTKHVTNGGFQLWKTADLDNITLAMMDRLFHDYHQALGYPLSHLD